MGIFRLWGSGGRVCNKEDGIGGWMRRGKRRVEEAEDEPVGGGAEGGC